jgi:hypothetical protein
MASEVLLLPAASRIFFMFLQQRQGLYGFAQAHVIGQAAAKMVIALKNGTSYNPLSGSAAMALKICGRAISSSVLKVEQLLQFAVMVTFGHFAFGHVVYQADVPARRSFYGRLR